MHRQFKKLLKDATGHSEFVISIFADIRGFSDFSQRTESPDTAMYVKRVFENIIDTYFPYASYYKPTGDGLLLIVNFNEKNLVQISNDVIKSAIGCVEKFSSICVDDPMINYDCPDKIGFGIARGTACRLESKGKIIDYSGRILNLSARLMNLARPMGIVIDEDFKPEILNQEIRSLLSEEVVYVRGISEDRPRRIYYTKADVEISEHSKLPIKQESWKKNTWNYSIEHIKKLGNRMSLCLPLNPPKNEENVYFEIGFPRYVNGIKMDGWRENHNSKSLYSITSKAGSSYLSLNLTEIIEMATAKSIPDTEEITIEFNWVINK